MASDFQRVNMTSVLRERNILREWAASLCPLLIISRMWCLKNREPFEEPGGSLNRTPEVKHPSQTIFRSSLLCILRVSAVDLPEMHPAQRLLLELYPGTEGREDWVPIAINCRLLNLLLQGEAHHPLHPRGNGVGSLVTRTALLNIFLKNPTPVKNFISWRLV